LTHPGDIAAKPDTPLAQPASATAAPSAPTHGSILIFCTFVLAFCSIVYELLLGQTLSAFLGNTVLRYSMTIGLYMASMGVGAMLARGRLLAHPVLALQVVEVLLTILGGTSVLTLFAVDAVQASALVVSGIAHGLIVVIGVLTGLEIPLLIVLQSTADDHAESTVLGIDYVGAFLGTVVFAFWFYPQWGIVPASLAVALLNAAVGLLLGVFAHRVSPSLIGSHRRLLVLQAGLLAVLLAALFSSSRITELILGLYLDH
jgi:spermidine synthase